MIIAAVQIASTPGDITGNIDKHIEAVRIAAQGGASLVAFPELSITGYEPTLAADLVFHHPEKMLKDLYAESAAQAVTIAVGIPTPSANKPMISQLFIRPDLTSECYSKQTLHKDEKPYFTPGNHTYSLRLQSEVIVPTICYESLCEEYAEAAAAQGATVFLSCVAKPESGVEIAHRYFSTASKKHGFVVIMSNAVGKSDNFLSAGGSAAWNRAGIRVGQLDAGEEAILMVDTTRETAAQLALSI